jgi:hypothetical protein
MRIFYLKIYIVKDFTMRLALITLLQLFYMFFIPDVVVAQTNQWNLSIEWEESRQQALYSDSNVIFPPGTRYLSFKDASYPDEELYFPRYFERIPMDKSGKIDSIRIENIHYTSVSVNDLDGVQNLEKLPEQFGIESTVAYQRGKSFVQLDILPLRKNTITGLVEKITGFTVYVSSTQVTGYIVGNKDRMKNTGSSVLATGKWYKIKIYKDGIYKLTYDDLEKIGLSNPQNIRVYGNGGKMLPLMNGDPRPDDLQENAVYMDKGTDDIFNKGDFILFYAKGIVTWNYDTITGFFSHKLNDYSDAAYYFLTTDFGPGKKIQTVPQATGAVSHTVTTFNHFDYYERNLINLIGSGRQWFSEEIASSFDTTFNVANIVTSEPVRIQVNVASRSASPKNFTISNGGKSIGVITIDPVSLNDFTGTFAIQKKDNFTFNSSSDQINMSVSYNKTEYAEWGWLDYITLNARRNLIMTSDPLFFRDDSSIGLGNNSRYIVTGATEKAVIWDVTDYYNVKLLTSDYAANTLTFNVATDSLREFVALIPGGTFQKPVTEGSDLGRVENQNLHGSSVPQLLIVTHPLFMEQANRLADFHRTRDNLSVLVATTFQIFNEFSSGAQDVSAIRDFARMLYMRGEGTGQELKYLLLFGDGSYNNHMQISGNSNFIPTYQSQASLINAGSYVSDDFFGFMDENEGGSEQMEWYLLDLGVGRLPVIKVEEARGVVDKIIGYNQPGNMRDWRNKILFVADDQDSNLHMIQANTLADAVGTNYPGFVIKKVLSDAYIQVATSTGARYPDVNKSIYDNFHKGILIFNYTGHGGEKGLAEEQLLTREQLKEYSNIQHLPLFVTATCEFSRFDDLQKDDKGVIKELTSAGEVSLLNPNGGSIALLSTTRVVYSDKNHLLNTKFYDYIFQRDDQGHFYRLGDIILQTKNSPELYRDKNKLNFTLLGDPALRLAIPEYTVVTDSLNTSEIGAALDTLKAFKEITIKGHLADLENNKLNDFNGTIYPSVYDKVAKINTLGNDGDDPMEFNVQDNIIYKGKANVTNGEFSFTFLVPKDITYSYGNGKISYYAQDSIQDANGYFTDFVIGGTNYSISADENGPMVKLYLNDENFTTGGITDRNPYIFARISDESGVNTSGNGIGHDIVGILDGDATQPIVLNDYYEADLDDYKNGSLRYPLTDLSAGLHMVKLRVWDIYNNPAEAFIEFEVIDNSNIVLREVYNYPNPAKDFTYFQFEHNKAGVVLKVTIDIFDLSGRKIKTIQENLVAEGYHSSPLEWDLKDQYGNMVGNGLYLYRVRVEESSGQSSDGFQKLLISH